MEAVRAGGIIKELEEAADKARALQLNGWILALKAAEASARVAQLLIRLRQANYRVKDEKSEAKGRYDQRRDALVAILQSLSPKELRPSTSNWIFQLHIADATAIANLLAPPLNTAVDFLSIAELTANRTIVGDAKLKR